MRFTLDKSALTTPSECMAIGKFPYGENGYYFVSANNQYFAASPITIEFENDDEEGNLYEVLDKTGNKLVYLPVTSLLAISKLTQGKSITVRYPLQTEYDEDIVVESNGNTFTGKVEKQYPITVLFPKEPLPRYSLAMNLTGLQVVTQQLKSGAYYYVNPTRTMAYAPIGDSAFVGFPVKEQVPMRWTQRPNSILSKFAKFMNADDEYSTDGESLSVRLFDNIRSAIQSGKLSPDVFDESVRKYFEFDWCEPIGETHTEEPTEEEISYAPDVVEEDTTVQPLVVVEEITDEMRADAARLGIDLSSPGFPDERDEDVEWEDEDVWDEDYQTTFEEEEEQ